MLNEPALVPGLSTGTAKPVLEWGERADPPEDLDRHAPRRGRQVEPRSAPPAEGRQPSEDHEEDEGEMEKDDEVRGDPVGHEDAQAPGTDPTGQGVAASAGVLVATFAVATALAWAGGRNGTGVGGVPAFAVCVALAFVIQAVAFVPAWRARTERYYDAVGSVTYLTVAGLALALTANRDSRSVLLAAMVSIWALRLGTFLYLRIRDAGSDRRFDEIKTDAARFLVAWMVQGLWVSVTAAPALAAILAIEKPEMGVLSLLGLALWLLGFTLETVADEQKRVFRNDPANRDRFIQTGLWRWSRHPNYFGEIVLWCGVALIAFPALVGWAYVTLISPVFVTLLLTRISGVPMLEEAADERWGGEPEYEAWKAKTPVLVPRPPGAPGP